MNHAQEYIETIEVLLPKIRDCRKFSIWQREMVQDWLAYFWNKGTISFVIKDGVGHGFCIVKLFRYLEQFLEPFIHDPCGRYIFIEELVANDPATKRFMWDELVDRWGPQEVVLWDRGERTLSGAPRMYRWKDFVKLSERFIMKGAV